MTRRERLVGREFEAGALASDLEAALAGEGRCVWIEGEAGIGKTQLLRRLADEADARGARASWGRCREHAGQPAYWPWIQAFEACDHAAGREIALRLADGEASRQSMSSGEPEAARFACFHEVARALARLAGTGPQLILLDDLQWSDAGSLELLAFVARELATLPVLIAVALRPERGPRFDALRALGRGLHLQGLSVDETGTLLAREHGREPPDTFTQQVHALTAGNPFFVIEMAQLMGDARTSDADGGILLPPRTREILARRMAPLPEASLAVLRTAAVFGLEFPLGALAAAEGLSPADARARLEVAIGAGILRERPGSLQRFAFSHALMRDALYEALSNEERARRHLVAARALEAIGDDPHGERISLLAHHYFEAARSGDAEAAIHYACEAGERALEQLAFEQAELHFERALAALELADPAPLADHVRALIGYGLACRWSDHPERGEPHLREGSERARALGPVLFAETVLRVSLQRAEFQVLDIETNELLREALRGLPDAPSSLRARVMARLASGLHLQPGAEDERLAMSRAAIAMARARGDAEALSFARSRCLANLLTPDHREERLRTVEEILADPDTKPGAELEARVYQIDDMAQAANRKGLDAALAVFEQRARAAGLPYFLWQVTSNRAAMALLEGRFAEAEQLASAALAQGGRVAPQSAGVRFSVQLFWLRGWQGRLAEVAPLVEASVEKTRVLPAWRCALAGLYLHSGREAEARREFDALATDDFRDVPRDSTWLVSMGLLADVCARLGDGDRAERLYAELLPWSGRIAVAIPLLVMNCPIDTRLGSLALLLGRREQAAAHQQRALSIAGRMRALPLQAEARYHLALALADADQARALEALEEADVAARSVGMNRLRAWIAEAKPALERRAARVAVATGTHSRARDPGDNVVQLPRARPVAPSAVFRREGEIWSLVFEGRPTQLRHMRGLAHLARLLAEPGRELHATDLAGMDAEQTGGDAGEHLDAHARAEYEARLRELRDEREEAERLNDRGRAERLSQEVEWLTSELARGFGLHGRERRAGAASERARQSVTRAIKYAIEKIEAHDPLLADHLRRNVRTGTFCCYAPPAQAPVSWSL